MAARRTAGECSGVRVCVWALARHISSTHKPVSTHKSAGAPACPAAGFVTSGLELWQGKPCAADKFRQRVWGGLTMVQVGPAGSAHCSHPSVCALCLGCAGGGGGHGVL